MTSIHAFVAAALLTLVGIVAGYGPATGNWPILSARANSAIGPSARQQADLTLPAAEPLARRYCKSKRPTEAPVSLVSDPMSTAALASAPGGPAAAAAAAVGEARTRKPRYYRNPMGLPDISPVPKKDEMGMDYIAVYADEAKATEPGVKVSLDKIQRAGVRSEPARRAAIAEVVRTPGVAKPDERTLRIVSLRADAFIDKLYVNQSGAFVKAGEPLFRIYSPDILRAVIDMRLSPKDGTETRSSLIAAEQKLRNFAVPEGLIEEAKHSKETPMAFDWPAPISGLVLEKMAVEGQMARMGEPLYRLADLTSIWVIADIAELDLGRVKVGDLAKVQFVALPGETFDGRVSFILHELDPATRTGKARIEVANPDHRIRHEMYANVEIAGGSDTDQALAVPASAVIDSGDRKVVIVDRGQGRFEPRPVKTGRRGSGLIEIREGLAEGENVVVAATFLIDAESNLQAALSRFTAGTPEPAAAPATHEGAP